MASHDPLLEKVTIIWRHLDIIHKNIINHFLFQTNKQVNDDIIKCQTKLIDDVLHSDTLANVIPENILNYFYEIKATEYILLVYTYNNIDDIYTQWKLFTKPFAFIANIFCISNDAGPIARFRLKLSTWYTKTIGMLIISGYIRRTAKNINVYIPTCIAQIVSVYYEPISLYSKVYQLFTQEIDNILDQTENNNQDIGELFNINRLESLYEMIGYDFLKNFSEKIGNMINKLNKECSDKYLSDQIGIMKYTNVIEKFVHVTWDNYTLNMQCVNSLIPSYMQNILNKNNGSYNNLVNELPKSQLKQIYNLFVNTHDYTEAKRLNNAFKNRK
eukprot:492765_1